MLLFSPIKGNYFCRIFLILILFSLYGCSELRYNSYFKILSHYEKISIKEASKYESESYRLRGFYKTHGWKRRGLIKSGQYHYYINISDYYYRSLIVGIFSPIPYIPSFFEEGKWNAESTLYTEVLDNRGFNSKTKERSPLKSKETIQLKVNVKHVNHPNGIANELDWGQLNIYVKNNNQLQNVTKNVYWGRFPTYTDHKETDLQKNVNRIYVQLYEEIKENQVFYLKLPSIDANDSPPLVKFQLQNGLAYWSCCIPIISWILMH